MSQYSEYIRGITFVEDTGEVDSVPFVPESDNETKKRIKYRQLPSL